jgi:hypothetical protein
LVSGIRSKDCRARHCNSFPFTISENGAASLSTDSFLKVKDEMFNIYAFLPAVFVTEKCY